VEMHALAARDWTVSAISRQTGRDRKTVSKYLKAPRPVRAPAPSCLEPFRAYVAERFVDDPHLEATVLHRELTDAGFDRSYPTLVRELRRLELRPVCLVYQHRRGETVTVEIEHPAGEEIQWDWLELHDTPWGEPAFVLVGALSHSGRFRGVFYEQMTFGHLAQAMHQVLVALGGTPRVWRTDRMATIVIPGTDRLTAEAAQIAKHYGIEVAVCPPRRAQRKGVVEAAIKYLSQELVADRGGHENRRGPDRPGRLVGAHRRQALAAGRHCWVARRSGAGALAAGIRLPGADHRRAQDHTLGAGRLRGQPLQRRARPRRQDRDRPRACRRAGPANPLRGRRGRLERVAAHRPVASASRASRPTRSPSRTQLHAVPRRPCSPPRSMPSSNASSKAACGWPSCRRARHSSSSTSAPSPRWTAAWSRTSRPCGSSRTRRTCSWGHPASLGELGVVGTPSLRGPDTREKLDLRQLALAAEALLLGRAGRVIPVQGDGEL
jgi:transposase